MEVKVSMSYLDDEKYSVKNSSDNELIIDMYAKDKKENLSPMELLLSAVTTCAAVEVVSMIKKRRSCLLYTSPSPRDPSISRMPSSA